MADRHSDIGRPQRRAVVDAVAEHGDHRARGLQRPHDLKLLRRADAGEDVRLTRVHGPVFLRLPGKLVGRQHLQLAALAESDLRGDGAGGHRRISRQHDRAHPGRFESLQNLSDALAHRIGEPRQPDPGQPLQKHAILPADGLAESKAQHPLCAARHLQVGLLDAVAIRRRELADPAIPVEHMARPRDHLHRVALDGHQRAARRMMQRGHEAVGFRAMLYADQGMARAHHTGVDPRRHRRPDERRLGRRAFDSERAAAIQLQFDLTAKAADLEQPLKVPAKSVAPARVC